MNGRTYRLLDRMIGEIDRAINVLAGPARAARAFPGEGAAESLEDPADRLEASRLMRVNHAGEVAAQALYRGQALTARNSQLAESMHRAAAEEMDHLAWCETRIKELQGRTSVLNPLWYAGSFLIGATAGLSGDRASLGFMAETERQVESHLRGHLDRLPAADRRSRAILEKMTHDEVRHGAQAAALGGRDLPIWVKGAMHLTSRLMTGSSRWI
jgi:ubiquinone biosynthesis monooxygenase Coq7